MKPTFLNRSEPLMTAMILEKDKEKILYYMDRAIKNGADALGLQFCFLDKACHNVAESCSALCKLYEPLPDFVLTLTLIFVTAVVGNVRRKSV